MIPKIQQFQAGEVLRLHLIFCRAGLDSVSSCGRLWIPTWGSASRCSGFTFQLCQAPQSHGRLGSGPRTVLDQPHQHPDVQSSASSCARAIPSCARLLIPVQDPCPAQHPAVQSIQLCRASRPSRIPHPAVQDCPRGRPYEATGLELFWMHVRLSH